jgi:hypothetical protein
VGFTVTCTPGREAAVGFMRITSELPALVIYLDPVNLVIQLPAYPGGDLVLARFCRELSREAAKLAAAVDPDEPVTPSEADQPAQVDVRGEVNDSGGRGPA